VGFDDHVANLPGEAASPAHQLAVSDDATTDART
jgi:hypothetical protein